MLIFMLIESILESTGCVVVGPSPRLAVACDLAEKEAIDAALLDVNLAGEKVFPVARILAAREVPFLFLTGYGDAGLGDGFAGRPVLAKPFTEAGLVRALRSLVTGTG